MSDTDLQRFAINCPAIYLDVREEPGISYKFNLFPQLIIYHFVRKLMPPEISCACHTTYAKISLKVSEFQDLQTIHGNYQTERTVSSLGFALQNIVTTRSGIWKTIGTTGKN